MKTEPLALVEWREVDLPGSHVCALRLEEGGYELAGAGTATEDGELIEVRFTVRCDEGWMTREAEVHVGDRSVRLRVDDELAWWAGDEELSELRGLADVDINFTPATNTLPIRRLSLSVGESSPVTAAWVRFPGLEVLPLSQTYERTDESRYRYASGNFTADLEVDEHGLVLDYPGGWLREPGSSPAPAG